FVRIVRIVRVVEIVVEVLIVVLVVVVLEAVVLFLDLVTAKHSIVLPGICAELHVKVPPSRTGQLCRPRNRATSAGPCGLYSKALDDARDRPRRHHSWRTHPPKGRTADGRAPGANRKEAVQARRGTTLAGTVKSPPATARPSRSRRCSSAAEQG